ncbi:MAG: glycosyltransferase family 4 protein, partial [Candidatus Hodarchaeota archaeon]
NLVYVGKGLFNPGGGAEFAASKLLSLITDPSIRITVLTDKNSLKEGNKRKSKKNRKILYHNKNIEKIIAVPLIKIKIPLITDIFNGIRFRKVIRQLKNEMKIDLIHIHGFNTFYVFFNSVNHKKEKKIGLTYIYTIHDFPEKWCWTPENFFPFNIIESIWKWLVKSLWRKLLNASKSTESPRIVFHALSSEIKEFLINFGIHSKNVFFLPNGRDDSYENLIAKGTGNKLPPGKREKFIVLCVGEINNRKNQSLLFRAMELNQAKNIKVILLGAPTPIVGRFYFMKIWSQLNPNIKGKIIWLGKITEQKKLVEVFNNSNLLVIPSFSEASPLVSFEAIQMEMPIISTATGSLIDTFPPQNRILKPNDPQLLGQTLDFFSENREKLKDYIISKKPVKTWIEIGNELTNHYFEFSNY